VVSDLEDEVHNLVLANEGHLGLILVVEVRFDLVLVVLDLADAARFGFVPVVLDLVDAARFGFALEVLYNFFVDLFCDGRSFLMNVN
jgi:hypothetical protein